MKLSILLPLLAQGQKEWSCKDLLPDNGCAKLPSNMCKNFYHANYQCPDTCGKCAGDPLRPINTVSVCYRDSPCNELGTEGGNADGCSQVELYPFFKCKCKPLWDGYRCQWFNCPCQNGGECRPCINNRKNCIDEKRKCSCPAGYTGRYCETKKRPSGPDKTPSPPTQPPTQPPTRPPTQPSTTTTATWWSPTSEFVIQVNLTYYTFFYIIHRSWDVHGAFFTAAGNCQKMKESHGSYCQLRLCAVYLERIQNSSEDTGEVRELDRHQHGFS